MGENRRREKNIHFRVTEEEYEEIAEAAERAGLTRSGWIRSHLLRIARQENPDERSTD